MRFVRAALALEAHVQGSERQVFLLEERIGHEHGPWKKYINNASPKPLDAALATAPHRHVAEFLVFTQHVQYLRTYGKAFVSDYQGA